MILNISTYDINNSDDIFTGTCRPWNKAAPDSKQVSATVGKVVALSGSVGM